MASGFNDDDFDWEAAVAEIDAACIRAEAAIPLAEKAGGSRNSIHQMGQPCHGSQSNQAKTFQQKTLDFFLADAGRKVGKLKLASDKNRGPSECAVFETGSDGGVSADLSVIRTWIYPANVPHRDYQFAITKTALFSNTLVSLPTGLGKTLIAAVVMYNYFRWFPLGKIVFTAPSRPLVVQQIEACHKIVGIPQDMTIDMTGQMNPGMRAENWQSRRVFFVTPQVLEKDIQSGTCTVKQIVCLVVDEAHRATGNYSYCVVVRELLAAKVQFRILALTATPGSKQITVQTVVDNLQISCLEYRDENDSDVSRYTHSRKLEVVEVAMNTESNNIKDLFLEVLQPIVYKLCQLGVFYSKDIGRLTPYEFLTARGKFREAPPQNLEQSRYGEVETNFGVAITLYHVFKLLFSHGIRPAYEMLQQKLQQGILRKMGCSDKLRQIQSMMKESVGHGAPSPKLAKVVEIILDHFSLHDGATTRVIIFTNFRESVKDIMETLTALGTTVKPMEFIGQSSGKASKGQTQKIQQAVLQKFRAGGYNTIVATSIAEEGLDIMEVDLVICFDANISPLRMIQRMGRTGRKRDGRVVVLASEGAELQGYLKKQAKSKAMGKHMDHGGIHSFDFHPSPRMIPHKFHPEVQLVELAIEEFVPRGRKLKPQESAIRLRDFNEDELQILQKYRNPPGAEAWKPSLIAFPRYQLLPTPVYQVKHSFRTTSMLIGALQRVQEAVYLGKEKLSNDFKIAIAQDQVYLTNDQVRFPTSQSERSPDIDNQTFGQVDIEDNILELRCSPGLESCKEHRDLVSCSSSTTYQPKYSLGIVSVSSSGDLYIASPPLLTTITEDSIFGNPADVHYESPSANEMLQAQQICNNQISTHETYNLNPLFPPANMECTVVDGVVEAQDVVSETQYTITPPVAVKSKVTFTKSKLLCANPDDSPRLSEFACRGVVPASPVPCISENKVHVPFDSGLAFSGARPLKHVIVEHDNSSPRTPVSAVPPIIETAEKSFKGLDCQSRYTVLAPQATSPPQPRTLEFSEPEPISSSSLQKVEQLEVNSLSIESANRKKCQGLEPVSSIVENLPKIQTSTPSAKTSISNSQDWQLHPEVSASAQRPHKLRRLRKAHDKQAMGSSEFQAVSVCSSGHVGLKVKPQQLKSKLGRHQRKFAVQAFVDLEAE